MKLVGIDGIGGIIGIDIGGISINGNGINGISGIIGIGVNGVGIGIKKIHNGINGKTFIMGTFHNVLTNPYGRTN